MSLRKSLIPTASVLILTAAAPRPAPADWLFTPFIGSTFGGSANIGCEGEAFKSEFERKLNYGASLTSGGPDGRLSSAVRGCLPWFRAPARRA